MKLFLPALLAVLTGAFVQNAAGEAPLTEKPVILSRAEAVLLGHQAPDVSFMDLQGKTHTLSSFTATVDKPFTVIAFTGTTCPLCQKLAPTLVALEKTWKPRGVQFLYVNPMSSEKPETLAAAVRQHGFEGPYVPDKDRALAAALRAKTTTEVFVLDAARTVLYRGAVDDQYGLGYQKDAPQENYLSAALESITAGRLPRIAATTAPGCELELPAAAPREMNALNWHRDIFRIVQNNCQECHRDGGTGPFTLNSREEFIEHAGMIRKVINKGQMPPWFAAPPAAGDAHALTWINDRSLPAADREALFAWMSGDRAEGDVKDAPLPRAWPQEWQIGTPDAIVSLPAAVEVKAIGRMKYINVQVATDFGEDRWVRGFEVKPTALAQVHHVLIFVIEPGKKVDGDNFLAAYVPGSTGLIYPEGYAKRLPAGAKLHFQLHYTPNGTATQDSTRLGLIFAKEKPLHEVQVAAVKNHRINIPAGESNHPETGTLPVPENVQLLAFMPHMHMRGKAFRYDLIEPDGARRTLLDVPHYDFNWQISYRPAVPVFARKGSRIEGLAHYDNSTENPSNPDPTKTVRWGDQTEEEMMLGYMEYVLAPAAEVVKPAAAVTKSGNAAPFSLTPKSLGSLGKRLDADKDKRISLAEAGAFFLPLHHRLDLDADGFVTRDEAKAVLALHKHD